MDCERKGKWIGGCKFEPRYNEEPLNADTQLKGCATAAELRTFIVRNVYVCDVCTTCGKTNNAKEA
jgi:hypothetical protein